MKNKTKKKLVEFGNMLLNKYQITEQVSHADIENYKESKKEQKEFDKKTDDLFKKLASLLEERGYSLDILL